MENFLNAGGFDPSAIISQAIGVGFAMVDANKTRKLQEQLAKLDLAQQKQLAERLQDVQGEIAIQQAFYEYLAVQNNNEMLNRIQNKRYTAYIVLGVGVLVLSLVVVGLKKKKNG